MFSKDRHGYTDFLNSSEHCDVVFVNKFNLLANDQNLLQQYPLPDVKKYYDEDQFYTQHVKAQEWFEKERQEHIRGDWFPYYKFLASRMNPDLPLIDVGCGAGWFMDWWYYNNYANVSYGVEPSNLAKENACCPIKNWIEPNKENIPDGEYNILMALVLEHIPDPVAFIRQYLPYMGKTGTLTIVVPNDFSSLQKWIGSIHFIQDVHINYFTPDSLLKTIYAALPESDPPKKYVIEMSATFPMELFEVFGFHYIGNDKIGKKCHQARLKFEKLFGQHAFRLYEFLFDKFGWGRELVFTIKTI